jgi:predicted ATP-dependent serine protease
MALKYNPEDLKNLTKEQEKEILELAKKREEGALDTFFLVKAYQKNYGVDWEDAIDHWSGNEVKIIPMAEAEKYQKVENVIPTGFEVFDKPMIGGIAIGSTVVIAAPSGHGKTAFMVTLSYGFLKQDIKCLWFSYEESNADVWERFKIIGVPNTLPAFCPLELVDNKLDYIEKVIRKFKKENDFFVVFIDQLSFLAPKVPKDMSIESVNGNYSMYLGLIAQQLKNIAMEQKIIIVFAHQLGRSGELAYSEAVKNATSKALFLNREVANTDSEEEFTDKTFVTFKKNRVPGGGKNPRILMTVENGLFVERESSVDMAKSIFKATVIN